jgi:hypothetical protein
MLIVNQQGTGIICRKIFFATSKLIDAIKSSNVINSVLRTSNEFVLAFATCAVLTVRRMLDSKETTVDSSISDDSPQTTGRVY